MKTGLGWYEENGRTYSVNTCQSCGASVTIPPVQMKKIRDTALHTHEYFDENIPCCDNPNFFWVLLA